MKIEIIVFRLNMEEKITCIYNWYKEFKKLDLIDRTKFIKKLKNDNDFKPLSTAFYITKEILKIDKSKYKKYLYVSVFCISIEGFYEDPRSNIAILALLNNSAEAILEDLNFYLNELKDLFENETSKYLENWIVREDKSIENFGFKEIRNEQEQLISYDTNNIIFYN